MRHPHPISGHLDLLRGKTCFKQDIDRMVPTWIRGRRIARHYLLSRELSPCPEVLSSLCQVCICGWFIPWYASLAVCYPIFPHPRLWQTAPPLAGIQHVQLVLAPLWCLAQDLCFSDTYLSRGRPLHLSAIKLLLLSQAEVIGFQDPGAHWFWR